MNAQKKKYGLAPWEKSIRHWDNQINEWFYSGGASYGCKIHVPDGRCWDTELESIAIKSDGAKLKLILHFLPISAGDPEWYADDWFSTALATGHDNYCQVANDADLAARKYLDESLEVNDLRPTLKTYALLLAILSKAIFASNANLYISTEDDQ